MAAALLILLACLEAPLRAQALLPLQRSNFTEIAPQGFGDRQNSWPWSMAWFQGSLYVGTMRAYYCVSRAALLPLGYQYPPEDPDIECTADYRDLPLEAEIWAWTPATSQWRLAFRSPRILPIPGTGKFTARDVGFRGMHVFREADGTEALYVGGCSAKFLYPSFPGGRLLRTVDGVNFTPVPQAAGTFLGDLRNACFRGIESHNGRMYLVAGSFSGEGTVIESADPASGNNSFRQITPQGALAYEIASFNRFLYVSFKNEAGFGLYKTAATGNLPYSWAPIITRGGYKQPNGNPIALSMKVFAGSLFVGGNSVRLVTSITCAIGGQLCVASILGNGGAELFRVHADDTWDLVVGDSRNTPVGPKVATSGIGSGFGWLLNQHLWRMAVFDGRLYVGTYDVATELRTAAVGGIVAPWSGFDLWYTSDGSHFTPVDVKGFGDSFSYGVRTLLATPAGLFLGAANPFYGLRVYRGVPSP